MAEKITQYGDFWPFYLRQHGKPVTRGLHYVGTSIGLALLAAAIATGNWWLLIPAFVCGYAFAWVGHFFVEHNRPATFTYPLWSFVSDFRMYGFWLSGRLGRELERLQIR